MENRNLLKIYSVITVIIIAAIMRILPHMANIAPITGLALFSGAYISKKWGFILPLGAMLLADYLIGLHSTMIWIYGSLLIIYLLGTRLKIYSFPKLFAFTLLSSTLFYLISNFGVWIGTDMYEKTWNGLFQCYIFALPFFRNTVIGDIVFTLGFFYGYKGIYRIFNAVFPQKIQI